MTVEPTVVLAHQGWDEILMFAVPVILLYLGIRWWDSRQQEAEDHEGEPPTADDA